MALLHNSLIRGYNSIFLQAAHVRDEDKADFVGYSKTWVRFIKSHHDDEEDLLFPEIKGMLSDQHVCGDMHEEHGEMSRCHGRRASAADTGKESFIDGLNELDTYLGSLSNASALTPGALLKIMDSFRKPLEYHLHHEVSVMAALATHPNVPQRHSFQGAVAAEMLKAWGKDTVRKAGLSDVVPLFLLNADRTAEGGRWRAWPPMPGPVRWGMVNLVGAVHGGWWRFASCDAQGQPRELYALTARVDKEKTKTEL